MINGIDGTITGDKELIIKLNGFSSQLRKEVKQSTNTLAAKLTAYIKQSKLSGQVLKNRSGTLRRKVNYQVNDNESSVTGTVGAYIKYAATHEFGFKGVVQIKEHLRMMKQAFGCPVANPHQVMVNSHAMRMNMPERAYMRPSLREFTPSIIREYTLATKRALEATK